MESYLVYASSALVIMGSLALALSVFFHFRFKKLVRLSTNSAATVFNRTFTVFDPYGHQTIFHKFLTLMPFIPMIGGFGVALLLLVIIDSGLLLTLLVVIMALTLIIVEESPEAYAESKLLLKAIEDRSNLGVGDIRLLHVTRKLLPKLRVYYLSLSVFLLTLASVLPYVWSAFLWDFAFVIGCILQASSVAGPTSWVLGILLYAGIVTAFIFLVTMAKSRLFGHHSELRVTSVFSFLAEDEC
jgi:hypothetical protein